MSDLVAAWDMNTATNRMLLDPLSDKDLESRYSPRTRSVAAQFAHMHNVRVAQMDKRAATKPRGLKSFLRGAEPSKSQLEKALAKSDQAVGVMLAECETVGRVKSWNGPPATFLGYFLAHEGHHRGLVLVSLRLSGVKLDQAVIYGLWYWSRKNP